MAIEWGFIVGASRIFKRVWQLYAAYVVLFVIYLVTITDVATRYAPPELIYEFNIAGVVDHPVRMLIYGLLLEARPLNLDILQLYIVLMAFFPPVLGLMLRKRDLALPGSAALFVTARRCDRSLGRIADCAGQCNRYSGRRLFGHRPFSP